MAVARSTRTVAERLASMTADVLGGPLPIRLRAWDGSEAGPVPGPVLVLHSRRALRRLLWSPGESGLAQAYIAGDLDIEGELAEGLSALSRAGTTGSDARPHIRPAQWPRVLAAAARLSILGPRPPAPGSAALRGRQHTGGSDLAATSYPD
jgi:cyclopropane-fatty-acyl-phospholipid synthase